MTGKYEDRADMLPKIEEFVTLGKTNLLMPLKMRHLYRSDHTYGDLRRVGCDETLTFSFVLFPADLDLSGKIWRCVQEIPSFSTIICHSVDEFENQLPLGATKGADSVKLGPFVEDEDISKILKLLKKP